jgi:hypothetical protein
MIEYALPNVRCGNNKANLLWLWPHSSLSGRSLKYAASLKEP